MQEATSWLIISQIQLVISLLCTWVLQRFNTALDDLSQPHTQQPPCISEILGVRVRLAGMPWSCPCPLYFPLGSMKLKGRGRVGVCQTAPWRGDNPSSQTSPMPHLCPPISTAPSQDKHHKLPYNMHS